MASIMSLQPFLEDQIGLSPEEVAAGFDERFPEEGFPNFFRDSERSLSTPRPVANAPWAILPGYYNRSRIEPLSHVVHLYTQTEHKLVSFITDVPVETGAAVNDHISGRPIELSMQGAVSDLYGVPAAPPGPRAGPPSGIGHNQGRSNADLAWAALRSLHRTGELFKVITPWSIYDNMAMVECSARQAGAYGGAMVFRIRLRQLTFATLQLAPVVTVAASGPAEDRTSEVPRGRVQPDLYTGPQRGPPSYGRLVPFIGAQFESDGGQGPSAPRGVLARTGNGGIRLQYQRPSSTGKLQPQVIGPFEFGGIFGKDTTAHIVAYQYQISPNPEGFTRTRPPWVQITNSADGEAFGPEDDFASVFHLRFDSELQPLRTQRYWVRVRAVNEEFTGAVSALVSAEAGPELLAPANVIGAPQGVGEAMLSWDLPNPLNPDIIRYEWLGRKNGENYDDAWNITLGTGPNTVSLNLSGFDSGETYYFGVRAYDDMGPGTPSVEVSVLIP